MRGGKGKRVKWLLNGGKYHGQTVTLSAGVTETLKTRDGVYRATQVRGEYIMDWLPAR